MTATITTCLASCTREEEAVELVDRLEARLNLQVPVSWMMTAMSETRHRSIS